MNQNQRRQRKAARRKRRKANRVSTGAYEHVTRYADGVEIRYPVSADGMVDRIEIFLPWEKATPESFSAIANAVRRFEEDKGSN